MYSQVALLCVLHAWWVTAVKEEEKEKEEEEEEEEVWDEWQLWGPVMVR